MRSESVISFGLVYMAIILFTKPIYSQKAEMFFSSLERMQLYFYEPLEDINIDLKKNKNEIFAYDARIEAHDKSFRSYLILNEENSPTDITRSPHVEFSRLIADLASNNEEHHIWARILNEDESKFYGADWAAEARFVPKRLFSHFPEARLLSLYRDGRGLASVVICHRGIKQFPKVLSFIE